MYQAKSFSQEAASVPPAYGGGAEGNSKTSNLINL